MLDSATIAHHPAKHANQQLFVYLALIIISTMMIDVLGNAPLVLQYPILMIQIIIFVNHVLIYARHAKLQLIPVQIVKLTWLSKEQLA